MDFWADPLAVTLHQRNKGAVGIPNIGYNGARHICPRNYPFLLTDPLPQTPLPASSLVPSDLSCQTASGSDPPFFHNALDRHTHTDSRQMVNGNGL